MTGSEFHAWLQEHHRLNERGDWPSDPRYYEPWRRRLDNLKADPATAAEASMRVAMAPPTWPREHLDAVCDAVVAIWRERDAGRGDTLRQRAAQGQKLSEAEVGDVRKLSASCPWCEGNGLAIRHGRSDPTRTATLHCVCILGRWMRERHRRDAPDVFRRILDLAEHEWMNSPDYGGPDLDTAEPAASAVPF